ncbi:PREDICTED: auxin-responsive protein SAUR36-like [Ipomoea nil]|uniref:auxin-responsive protein SAUR36-like n=1 Tax=Ipomoea nil TaxID=35883 RepID=UPI000900CA10|nr:PREDICTED: auxin-responsive protein SAUR36-like [Ipomoea nil]
MRRLGRGFSVKHRVTTLFRCMFRRHRCSGNYQRLDAAPRFQGKIIHSVVSWTRRLGTKAKAICSKAQFSGYLPAGKEAVSERAAAVPKGHLAVYVGGEKGEDFTRVLVPVIYFNHPLFGELLREAEKEFGFNHPGGITLPCRISEFERVQTRIIRESCGSGRMVSRRR